MKLLPIGTLTKWCAIHAGWELLEDKIKRTFIFDNFRQALSFVNRVGALSEEVDHHPDIFVHNWNQVTITLFTHSAGGITRKDLLLADKIDSLINR